MKNGNGYTEDLFALESPEELSPLLLDSLNEKLEKAHPDQILTWGFGAYGSEMVLGTGFGPSGVFLMHRIQKLGLAVPVFYLDTHLLFDETYKLRDRLEEVFDIRINRISTSLKLEEQAEKYGDELWKTDPDQCCYLRKVLPLRNYLSDKKAWVTGIRRNQSEFRKQTQVVEWDAENRVVKINPVAAWTENEVWEYIHDQGLPYNPLHDEGYPSIGCIPCTDPVDPSEGERAGRWRGTRKTECGIHGTTQRNGTKF